MRRSLLVFCLGLACSARSLDGLSRDFRSDPARADAGPGDAAPVAPLDARVTPPVMDAAPEPARPPEPTRPDAESPPDASVDLASPLDVGAPDTSKDGRPDVTPVVVLVVDSVPLGPDDAALAQHLGMHGLLVQPCADDSVATCDVSTARLVFVSPSSLSTKVGTTFRTLAKPVIVSDAPLYDDMALVADDLDVDPNDHGNVDDTAIVVDGTARPFNAGLIGTVTLAPAAISLNWGLPGSGALRAASLVGRPDRAAIFAYPAGTMMVGLRAPARRVGLFIGEKAAASLTADAWALVDAAVTWALQ